MKNTLLIFVAATLLMGALKIFAEESAPKPLIIVYDFSSAFDEGKLGAKTAEVIRERLRRKDVFTLLDDFSFAEVLSTLSSKPTSESSPEEVASTSSQAFQAEYAIWGTVEEKEEGYPITFRSTKVQDAKPVDAAEVTLLAPSKHEIQGAVDDFLDILMLTVRPEGGPTPEMERRWKNGVNLVKNGDMEIGSDFPEGFEKQHDVAFTPDITWVDSDRGGKCIRLAIDRTVAESYGVLCYSPYFDLEPGATYRASVDVKTFGPVPKIFVKCYAEIAPGDWREVYRHHKYQVHATKEWQTFVTQDFTPKSTQEAANPKFTSKRARVMMYAYVSPGEIFFANVAVKRVK